MKLGLIIRLVRSVALFTIITVFATSYVFADTAQVAVAANFTAPVKEIAEKFEKQTGHKIVLSFGGTGSFYAGIKNGAPYDILLAADNTTPLKLADEGFAIKKTNFTYAQGLLVLWSADKKLIDKDGKVLLDTKNYKYIAMADPKLAPYGLAAEETLKKLNLFETLNKNKQIVEGKNIAQTHQFIDTGNSQLGFVAFSQIYKDGTETKGSYWLIPVDYYSPIKQDGIILKNGENNKAAIEFLEYLKSEDAIEVIKAYGYKIIK